MYKQLEVWTDISQKMVVREKDLRNFKRVLWEDGQVLRRLAGFIMIMSLSQFTLANTEVNTDANQEVRTISGFELPLGFAGAEVSKSKVIDDGAFRIPLGGAEKLRRQVVAEKSELWAGQRSRTTWELPKGFQFDDAAAVFNQFLASQQSAKQLFHCESFACGASAFWVNNLLEMPIITGLDETQGVWVWREEAAIYLVYLVQRGNRDIYLFLQKVEGQPL